MKFKNKTGWIHEELEKKNECLNANEFGGENPEDVEKQREKNAKEINKRFDGVRKTAEKTVGDDHEEHAKPHKVEEHFKTRKELAEATKELKDSEIKFTVNRSSKEGFRYVLEYFTTARIKKDEPLFEKLELDEGMISGAKELSYDELANLEKSLWDKLNAQGIYPEDGTFSNSSNRLADLDLELVIDGDWKHDHLFAEHLVEEWCKENGYVITRHTESEIGNSDSDWYEAEHHWFLIKDTDGKMSDTVAGFKKMFSREESLKEGITFEVNDDGDLVAKSKDNFLIIGSEEDKDLPDEEKKKRMMAVLNDFKNDDAMKSEYDYWMSILNESLKEDLPDAIPEEPLVVSTDVEPEVPAEVVPDEVIQTGIYSALSSELRDTLADIENLKSLTVTLVDEGREDIVDDLNTIIDDRTIHVGMLQTLMEKVDAKVEAEETNTAQDKEDMMDAEIVEPEVKEESLNEAVDIHVEDNEIIVSKDLEEVAIIPVDGEEEPKEESLNEEWQYCNCKDLDEVAKLSDYCAKNGCKITAKTQTNDGYKCRIEGPFDNVHKVNDKWSMFKWRGTPLEEEIKDESLNEELEAGDCVYHPERDEYYYLKKTDKPNKFELYTHSDTRGFEIASPRFIDKNSPFYNKLKLQTKNANPEFKESLNEDMKPWMMQQGENGEPEYIGFAKSHDDMLDKMVKSHASDSIGENTYIDELDKDTYEYIKKDLSDDEIKELDNYFKD